MQISKEQLKFKRHDWFKRFQVARAEPGYPDNPKVDVPKNRAKIDESEMRFRRETETNLENYHV